MSKKQLFNRLDGLFSELKAGGYITKRCDSKHSIGWDWECDPQGLITNFSDGFPGTFGSLCR